MKKSTISIVLLLAISTSSLVFNACKKKDPEPDNSSTPKTLNKSLLVGKKWYNEAGTTTHDIRVNGVYGAGGTWEWKNNSDTMIIDLDGTGSINPPVEWKFYWSAEHEMACKRATSSSGEILYKDQPW